MQKLAPKQRPSAAPSWSGATNKGASVGTERLPGRSSAADRMRKSARKLTQRMPWRLAEPPALMDWLLIAALALLAAALAAAATVNGPGANPDAVNYMTTGTNLAAGRGFVTSLSAPFQETLYSPLTFWPPGYPLLIAPLVWLGLTAASAARWISILGLAATLVAVYWLGWRMGGRTTALFGAALTLALAPLLQLATLALSETSYIALTLFSTLALVHALHNRVEHAGRVRVGWLAVSALCAGAAILMRYVGVVWLGVGSAAILLNGLLISWPNRRHLGRALLYSVGYGLLGAAPVLPWFYRNWQLTGSISGMNRGVGYHPTWGENVLLMLQSLGGALLPSFLLGLGARAAQLSLPTMVVVALAAVVILLAAGALFWLGRRAWRARRLWLSPSVLRRWVVSPYFLLLVHALLYIVFILFLASTLQFAPYDWPRYLAVVYPALLLLGVATWTRLAMFAFKSFKRDRIPLSSWTEKRNRVRFALVVLLPLLLVFTSYARQTRGFLNAAASGQGFAAVEWRTSTGLQFLRAALDDSTVNVDGSKEGVELVYSNSPGAVAYQLDYPVRFLPYTDEAQQLAAFFERDALQNRQGSIAAPIQGYFILFSEELSPVDNYFRARFTADDVEAFFNRYAEGERVFVGDDAVIYRFGLPSAR